MTHSCPSDQHGSNGSRSRTWSGASCERSGIARAAASPWSAPASRFTSETRVVELTLDWHGVTTLGETILGPPPLDLGPPVSRSTYRHAVETLLKEWPSRVRASWVAYVPAHQGYVVMTLCRALYALATGEQATKEEAATWAAARYPEWSSFISEAHATYRADVRDSHHDLISFTDYAVAQADDPNR